MNFEDEIPGSSDPAKRGKKRHRAKRNKKKRSPSDVSHNDSILDTSLAEEQTPTKHNDKTEVEPKTSAGVEELYVTIQSGETSLTQEESKNENGDSFPLKNTETQSSRSTTRKINVRERKRRSSDTDDTLSSEDQTTHLPSKVPREDEVNETKVSGRIAL